METFKWGTNTYAASNLTNKFRIETSQGWSLYDSLNLVACPAFGRKGYMPLIVKIWDTHPQSSVCVYIINYLPQNPESFHTVGSFYPLEH